MIQPQSVQQRGVQIMHVDLAFDGFVSDFVSGSVPESGLNAAASEKDSEATRVVVSSIIAL